MAFLKLYQVWGRVIRVYGLGINWKIVKWERIHIMGSVGELQPKHSEICDQAHRIPRGDGIISHDGCFNI